MTLPPTITERFPPVPMPELLKRIDAFVTDTRGAQQETRRPVDAHAITGMHWGQGWRYRRARILESRELDRWIGRERGRDRTGEESFE